MCPELDLSLSELEKSKKLTLWSFIFKTSERRRVRVCATINL